MPWYDNIKNIFNKTVVADDSEALAHYSAHDPKPVETQASVQTPPPFPLEGSSNPLTPTQTVQKEAITEYSWIENEDILRDEGVIFGLTNDNPDENVAIIRNYFSHKTADVEREVEQLNEKIQELNLFIEQRETRIKEAKEKTEVLEHKLPEGQHELPRTVIGFVCSLAMCVGNYFLISDTIRPLFPNGQWVAMGVFLAGMFNLFGRISIFHETQISISWRNMLEEIGMPLAAALFVAAQAIQSQSIMQTLALFGFVFFLFLFAGKLMLSTLTVLRRDLQVWQSGVSLKSEKTIQTARFDEEIKLLEEQIDEFRIQKWQILPNLNRAEGELTRLTSRRDMLIKIFESEFYLAKQVKQRLNQTQIRKIIGD